LPMRSEAWCIATMREPPRLVAVADNRLFVTDLSGDKSNVAQDVLSGVARPPWKRPIMQITLLDVAGDVLCAGVSKGVLLWRVPALLAPIPGAKVGEPELLAAIPIPARCNFVSVSLGLSLGNAPLGWVAVDLTGAIADSSGSLDVWHFFTGRERPSAPVTLASGPGGHDAKLCTSDNTTAKTVAVAGTIVDALAAALRRAVTAYAPKLGEPNDNAASLRTWVCELPDNVAEALYTAANNAEQTFAEMVRELRRWLRAQSRGAARPNATMAARIDAARSAVQWAEDCRRSVVWPLQTAFEADVGNESPSSDDEEV